MNLPEKSMVEIDSEYGDGMYGAHTIYDDNNNMAYKTFCETTEGFTASNTTGYYSDDINTRVQRRIYRVRITKQSGLAARFITVLYPIGKADEYDGTTISASFTDNEGGTPGTFHEDGTSVEVTVGDKTYELTCEINN
jgi:heparan-sulfate lyase